MKKILFFFFIVVIGCKKDKEVCWQVYDSLGNQMAEVCNKTEAEIAAQYGPYYDNKNASKYCWSIEFPAGNTIYPENLTEKLLAVYYPGAVNRQKINCGYCQRWAISEKGMDRITGNFAYKPAVIQQYCGDTCNTLYQGRSIIIRKTTDSLITVVFLQRL